MNEERKHVLTARYPVRWGDMDAYGHVNNTVYFRYFEQIRVEWVEQLGFPVNPNEPSGAIIVNADCTFHAPVTYPATIEVRMFVGQPGRASLMTWYELYVEGDEQLYATGGAKLVWMDTASGRSTALPAAVREAAS